MRERIYTEFILRHCKACKEPIERGKLWNSKYKRRQYCSACKKVSADKLLNGLY